MIQSIRHYVEFWEKPSKLETVENRLQDWTQCGGTNTGDFSPEIKQIQLLMKDGMTYSQAREKLERNLQICMKQRGYAYTK